MRSSAPFQQGCDRKGSGMKEAMDVKGLRHESGGRVGRVQWEGAQDEWQDRRAVGGPVEIQRIHILCHAHPLHSPESSIMSYNPGARWGNDYVINMPMIMGQ
jgi:hypothetical protein